MYSKIFDRWDLSEVQVNDIGIEKYVCLKPVGTPHSSGRHANQQFNKSEISIVERLVNNLMRGGRNTGKKTTYNACGRRSV